MIDRRQLLKALAALGIAGPSLGVPRLWRAESTRAAGSEGAALMQSTPSSRQLAGQRVIYSYPGLTPPDALLQTIRDGEAAGIIFFAENIENDEQIAAVVEQLVTAQEASPVAAPLLLMTDQEGGLVRRLPGPPDESAKDVGQAADPEAAAQQAGDAAGRNLAAVGMNVNLAPVLGVYREDGDFLDQYERAFSNDATTVGLCSRAFISGQQDQGVAATAKHFPGLGAAGASQNTDAEPVTLPVPATTLRAVDEAPYLDALAADVRLVMLSWAIYPDLDPDLPAGLSATIISGELRERIGFDGVTITDALEAGSLAAYGNDPERAVRAAAAGMDLILCSARDVDQGAQVTAALAAALDTGTLAATAFDDAVARVTTLRSGLATRRYFPETGHLVSGGFLSYWARFGGLPTFGYPITDEFTAADSGFVTQYFERARFEWHPGSAPERYDVLLGLLGRELAQRDGLLNTPSFQPADPGNNEHCTYYPETGHWLCYGFRDYWQSHGALEILGYPISEEFADPQTGLTVQYFERQRLEWHPDNAPEWQVLGGLLGSELLPPDL